ncbi:MAG: YlxR family protein [Dehalococcoidales bacterium]|nr:YlxR family protein [Dehalococcoidales bacterium]
MTKARPVQPLKKHLPRRTCIACRTEHPKRELVRLVYIEGEGVDVDLSGKKSGRGAYLCPDEACWVKAITSGKLETALRTSIKTENREKLVNYAKGLNNTYSGV